MNAIEVDHVSKTYRIPHERRTSLAEHLLSLFRPLRFETFAALSDVSFDVPEGSFVGVIGANGSGKSTLLKILAGVLLPDRGEVRVRGSLAPLLELGLGFQQELTVAENVVLYGTVLGYPHRDMRRRVEEVIAFAGLERFRDAKLKSLSSGMLVRLAFATALRADADILLLDEVLAVGDAVFQRRCLEVFGDLQQQRKTMVLVSHDLAAVQRFCDKVYWLDAGRLVMAGDASEVVHAYLAIFQAHRLSQAASPTAVIDPDASQRWGDGRIRYLHGALESEDGAPLTRVVAGRRVVLRLTATVHEPCREPVFGFALKQLGGLGGHVVYTTNNVLLGRRSRSFAAGDRIDIRMPFTAALLNGHYAVHVAVADEQGTFHDWVNDFVTFSVEESRCAEGVADLLAEFRFETCEADPLPGTGTDPRVAQRKP
jgi:lipopolysaccharide transport system ATP-binding protein